MNELYMKEIPKKSLYTCSENKYENWEISLQIMINKQLICEGIQRRIHKMSTNQDEPWTIICSHKMDEGWWLHKSTAAGTIKYCWDSDK